MLSNTAKAGLAGVVLCLCAFGVVDVGRRAWPSTPEPKAVISVDGQPAPPSEVDADGLVVLSAETSTAGKSAKSVSWAVEPSNGPSVIRVGRQLILSVGSRTPRIVVKLHVASGDAIDSTQVAFTVKGAKPADPVTPVPTPGPGPLPTPTPTPVPPPDPGPSGPVDAAIRRTAADYYGALPSLYAQAQSQIAATDVDYATVHEAMKARRDAVADALAAAMDAAVHATLADDGAAWKDKAAGAQAHGLVGRSLAAGLRDAAAAAPR